MSELVRKGTNMSLDKCVYKKMVMDTRDLEVFPGETYVEII